MQPSELALYEERLREFAATDGYAGEIGTALDGVGRGEVALDVGCGPGFGTRIIAGILGSTVVGVDIEPGWLTPPLRLAGDAARLPLADGSFSLVTMIHSLGHVAEPATVLTEARRVLEPGGRLVVVTPNRRFVSWMRPLNLLRVIPYRPDATVVTAFTASRLADLLSSAGFRDVEVVPHGALPPLLAPLGSVAAAASERLIARALKPIEPSESAGRLGT